MIICRNISYDKQRYSLYLWEIVIKCYNKLKAIRMAVNKTFPFWASAALNILIFLPIIKMHCFKKKTSELTGQVKTIGSTFYLFILFNPLTGLVIGETWDIHFSLQKDLYIFPVGLFIDAHSLFESSLQHLVFPGGLPSKYWPGPTLLSFRDQTRLVPNYI